MYPILFENEFIIVHSYGLFISFAILISYFVYKRLLKTFYQKRVDYFFDLIFFVLLVIGFIGAKVFYYIENKVFSLRGIFSFWEPGLSSIGGVIFILISLSLLIKLISDRYIFLNIIAITYMIGLSVGKIGCFCKGCCYGKPTDSILGITFPPKAYSVAPIGIKIFPIQIIESGLYLFLGLFFYNFFKRQPSSKILFFIMIIVYCTFRFFIDFLRWTTFKLPIIGLTITQSCCLLLIFLSFYFIRDSIIKIKARQK